MQKPQKRFLYDSEGEDICELLRNGETFEAAGLDEAMLVLFRKWLVRRLDDRARLEILTGFPRDVSRRYVEGLSAVFGRPLSTVELDELARFFRSVVASVEEERDRSVRPKYDNMQEWMLGEIWPKVEEARKCRENRKRALGLPVSSCAQPRTKTHSSNGARNTSPPMG